MYNDTIRDIVLYMHNINALSRNVQVSSGIDLSSYDAKFWEIIDTLGAAHFGKELWDELNFAVFGGDKLPSIEELSVIIKDYSERWETLSTR